MIESHSLLDDPGFVDELNHLDPRLAPSSALPDDAEGGADGVAAFEDFGLDDDPTFSASLLELDRGIHPVVDELDDRDPRPAPRSAVPDDPTFSARLLELDRGIHPSDAGDGAPVPQARRSALPDDPTFNARLLELDRGIHSSDPGDGAPVPHARRAALISPPYTAAVPVRTVALAEPAASVPAFETVAATVRTAAQVPASEVAAASVGACSLELAAEIERNFNPVRPGAVPGRPVVKHGPPLPDFRFAEALPASVIVARRAAPLQGLAFAAFILLMTSVGACASVLVFHERVSQIILHW